MEKEEYVAPQMEVMEVELESSILSASAVGVSSREWDNDNDYQY